MVARLTTEQVAHYREQGYLLPREPVFAPEKFQRLQKHFDELLKLWLEKGVSRSPEHMDVPHFWDPTLFQWLFDDEVLNLVEPILGPDIVLFSSHFICKPPAVGKRVPWHEDSAYWKGRLDPMEVVTVWLAIDPSTPANGCMKLIPGTHRHGFSEYEKVSNPQEQVFSTEIKAGLFDESKAVDCILEPNQCSLHDGRIIHGSNANTGTMRRCGYTMRYMSAKVKYVRSSDRPDPFQIYLARGKNLAGNQLGDPTRVNHAWLKAHPGGQPAGH